MTWTENERAANGRPFAFPFGCAQPAAATAGLASTVTRWARYSALPWMSLFRPSAGILMPATASGDQLLASASSIGLQRKAHGPAPVTATRGPDAVWATNTPTMA